MKKRFFTKKKITIFIIMAVIALVGWRVLASRGTSKITYTMAKTEKTDLIQTVSEVGTVNSPKEIVLNFPTPGELQIKFVKIGDKVKAGQILAQLDYQALIIQRDQAQANLAAAQASLEKLQRGATAEEIAVVTAQLNQAKANYASALDSLNKTKDTVAEEIRQAEKNLSDLQDAGSATPTTYEQAVISAQIVLDNTKATYQKAINNSADSLLNDLSAKLSVANTAMDNIDKIISDDDIEDYLSSKNKTYLDNTKSTYNQALTLWNEADVSLKLVANDKSEEVIIQTAGDVLVCLKKVSESLDYLYGALENSSFSSQTTLDTYKTNINTQITYISTAIGVVEIDRQTYNSAYLSYSTNVATAQNSLDQARAALTGAILTAQNTLASARISGDQRVAAAQNSAATALQTQEVAQKQLTQLKAPPRAEDVSLAQAKVSDALAALDLTNKKIDDCLLKSPIDGQIVKDNYEVGEQTSAATPVFSVLAENSFEIDVDISESDIAKIKPGQEAKITLDAFGSDLEFNGQIYFIEPASTVIQDVIYYKVKIKFIDPEDKLASVKPGMTANVTVITAKKEKVLAVPERAVIKKDNGEKVLRTLSGEKLNEVPVTTGLRGDGGLIEILGGNIKEGEKIVVSMTTK